MPLTSSFPSCRAGAELVPRFCTHTLRGKRFFLSFALRLGLTSHSQGAERTGRGKIVMTVDSSYKRVLVNAQIDPSGAASLYRRASGSFETGLIGGPRILPCCTHATACSFNPPVNAHARTSTPKRPVTLPSAPPCGQSPR